MADHCAGGKRALQQGDCCEDKSFRGNSQKQLKRYFKQAEFKGPDPACHMGCTDRSGKQDI